MTNRPGSCTHEQYSVITSQQYELYGPNRVDDSLAYSDGATLYYRVFIPGNRDCFAIFTTIVGDKELCLTDMANVRNEPVPMTFKLAHLQHCADFTWTDTRIDEAFSLLCSRLYASGYLINNDSA